MQTITIPMKINVHPIKDTFVGISLKNKYPPHIDASVLDAAQHIVIVFNEYKRMLIG